MPQEDLVRLIARVSKVMRSFGLSHEDALAQLRCSHCRLLNSYKAYTTSSISDVCPECGVAPYSVEHLFNCQILSVKAIRRNLQCKTCGTTQLRSQTSSTWTTDDRRRAAGLSQQQQDARDKDEIKNQRGNGWPKFT